MIYKIVFFEFLFIVELEWSTPNMKNWCLNPQTSSGKKSVHAKIQSEPFLCQIHPLLISSSRHMISIETQNCLCEKLAFSFFNINLCRCLLLRGIKVWCLHVFATFGFHVQGTWVLLSVAWLGFIPSIWDFLLQILEPGVPWNFIPGLTDFVWECFWNLFRDLLDLLFGGRMITACYSICAEVYSNCFREYWGLCEKLPFWFRYTICLKLSMFLGIGFLSSSDCMYTSWVHCKMNLAKS